MTIILSIVGAIIGGIIGYIAGGIVASSIITIFDSRGYEYYIRMQGPRFFIGLIIFACVIAGGWIGASLG